MKRLLLSVSLLSITAPLFADPMISSWLTANSRKYARLYTSDANRLAGASVTMWSNSTQTQAVPAYCGVQEVSYSSTWLYIKTNGMGGHIMGPWYLNAGTRPRSRICRRIKT
jgi:hypothetical protein